MREAGFLGFERGERGSTAAHLSVLEYKTQQEAERAAALAAVADEKQQAVAVLDKTVEKKQGQLAALDKKTAVAKTEAATFSEIDRMGEKKTFKGDVALSPADWKTVSGLAKEGVKSRSIVKELKEKVSSLLHRITGLDKRLQGYEGKGITDTMRYYQAQQRARAALPRS
jgi:hypothetical protein